MHGERPVPPSSWPPGVVVLPPFVRLLSCFMKPIAGADGCLWVYLYNVRPPRYIAKLV